MSNDLERVRRQIEEMHHFIQDWVRFVAIAGSECAGSDAFELAIYAVDADGDRALVSSAPSPRGQGKSCDNVPPEASSSMA